MQEIRALEAKNRLDAVERGKEIVITRPGKSPSPASSRPGFDRERARRVVEGIIERSKGVTLGGLKIKDLINEGRRW